MNLFRAKKSETAPLESYINQAWKGSHPIKPFGERTSADAPTPTLRRGCKNRIIYYVGSFNPPHLGHLALVDHVFSNTKAPLRHPGSAEESDDSLNAVALVVIPHGEYWIARKSHRAAREREQAKYPRGRGKGKGKGKSAKKPFWSTDGDDDDDEELHLDLEQRLQLVRGGVPEDLVQSGVWVFPADAGQWYQGVQPRLRDACRDDGFEVEFVELLGPDYVKREWPQCSGMHGVVTSNVCRAADFVTGKRPPGSEIGSNLLTLNGFSDWALVRSGDQPNVDAEGGAQITQDQENQEEQTEDKDKSNVWVCQGGANLAYRIWFVECEEPRLDPGMSSTGLRRLIHDVDLEVLEEVIQDTAMSPAKLVEFVRDIEKEAK
ncbi:hypothetical protein BJ166DRAFT_511745 [Pestalotiopsis sp. NC0098]|nr:hypothetical protein BJ166DRAFT_511745 [Pestalotiopsis sp. NC0098]